MDNTGRLRSPNIATSIEVAALNAHTKQRRASPTWATIIRVELGTILHSCEFCVDCTSLFDSLRNMAPCFSLCFPRRATPLVPQRFFVLLVVLYLLTAPLSAISLPTDLYVIPANVPLSPFLSVTSALRSPRLALSSQSSIFSTIEAALAFVEQTRTAADSNATTRITVHLCPTTHYLTSGPLRLTTPHSNLHLTTMTPATQRHLLHPSHQPTTSTARATISGGIAFPAANWTRVGTSNVYTSPLPRHVTGPVNQLFSGSGQRIPRTRLPLNYSEYYQYNHSLPDPAQAYYGFVYNDGQFDNLSPADLTNAMVVVYHSWTASRHYIDRVYKSNNTVMFTNPALAFIGYFIEQAQKRFHIENVCDVPEALQPNTFCYNNVTRMVTLATDGSYDPTDPNLPPFVTPFVQSVMNLVGFGPERPLTNVLIDNINLQHSGWAIDRNQTADRQSVSWSTTAGLMLQYANQVLISNVALSHHGVYAIYLQEGTTAVTIIDCTITDMGAGGIRMGQMDPAPAYPTTGISVLNTEIAYGGQVFYDGVGIIVHRARSVTLANNHIHHLRYTGISAGWQWGYDESYTSNVVIAYNFIHDIGQHILNDMGGIYMVRQCTHRRPPRLHQSLYYTDAISSLCLCSFLAHSWVYRTAPSSPTMSSTLSTVLPRICGACISTKAAAVFWSLTTLSTIRAGLESTSIMGPTTLSPTTCSQRCHYWDLKQPAASRTMAPHTSVPPSHTSAGPSSPT